MSATGRSLFRREALQSRRICAQGEISLAQPVPVWILAVFALTAVASILVFLASGEYTRRSRVAGQLVPDAGLVTVTAPVDGVVARALPPEGAQVGRGAPLVVIATPRATSATGETTEDLLAQLAERRTATLARLRAEERLLDERRRGAAAALAAARRELEQIEAAAAFESERLRLAEGQRARLEALAARRYVSRLQLAEQAQAALGQAAALQALRRQAAATEREILGIEQRLRELALEQRARAAAEAAELAELEEARLRLHAAREVLVKAPLAGSVASTLAEPGQSLRAGQPLLSLVPSGAVLQAQLFVPSRAAGFVERGDVVLLRYPAFPHEKFGHHQGRVVSVSRAALDAAATAALTGGTSSREPVYRVLVALAEHSVLAYGRPEPLRPGMLVEADILGERRKLLEWLLEPLYAVGGRL